MSKLITNTIRHTGGSADNITLDNSKNVTVEGNATVSGTIAQTIDADAEGVTQTASGNHYIKNVVDANRSSAGASIVSTVAKWNGKEVAGIKFTAGSDTTNKDNGRILFETANANDITERVRIDTEGKVGIGTTGPNSKIHILGSDATNTRINVQSTSATVDPAIQFTNSGNTGAFNDVAHITTDIVNGNAQGCLIFKTRSADGAGNDAAERVRIQSGGGISFNGDTAAANALDDYEEGTWTPTESSLSLTVHTANYVKIGKLVHVDVGMEIPTNSDGGELLFGGLPFTAQSSGDNSCGLHLTSTNSGIDNVTIYAIRNTTTIGLATYTNTAIARSSFSNKQLKFSGTYIST